MLWLDVLRPSYLPPFVCPPPLLTSSISAFPFLVIFNALLRVLLIFLFCFCLFLLLLIFIFYAHDSSSLLVPQQNPGAVFSRSPRGISTMRRLPTDSRVTGSDDLTGGLRRASGLVFGVVGGRGSGQAGSLSQKRVVTT